VSVSRRDAAFGRLNINGTAEMVLETLGQLAVLAAMPKSVLS